MSFAKVAGSAFLNVPVVHWALPKRRWYGGRIRKDDDNR